MNDLKSAITPIKIPATRIFAAAEEGNSRLFVCQKSLVRAEVNDIPRLAKPRPENAFQSAFNSLEGLDRFLLSPDKGNCVAVMFRQLHYHEKVLSLRQKYAFNLSSYPTNKARKRLSRVLLDLKKAKRAE